MTISHDSSNSRSFGTVLPYAGIPIEIRMNTVTVLGVTLPKYRQVGAVPIEKFADDQMSRHDVLLMQKIAACWALDQVP